MGDSLVIRTDASYTLNFLVYLQNLFLNQKNYEEAYKFPYIPCQLAFDKNFEFNFQKLWNEVCQRLAEDNLVDLNIFHNEKEFFYQRLFVASEDSVEDYNEIHQAFNTWADSLAGRFGVEKSVGDVVDRLYEELTYLLIRKGMVPRKDLNLSIVYDHFPLGDLEVSPYFVIASIEEFLVQPEDVLAKLQRSLH